MALWNFLKGRKSGSAAQSVAGGAGRGMSAAEFDAEIAALQKELGDAGKKFREKTDRIHGELEKDFAEAEDALVDLHKTIEKDLKDLG
jgi:hypothetical protein